MENNKSQKPNIQEPWFTKKQRQIKTSKVDSTTKQKNTNVQEPWLGRTRDYPNHGS